MPWYTVSIIYSCRLAEKKQKEVIFCERFVLFEAESHDEAWDKAERDAQTFLKNHGSLKWNGQIAYWQFEGVRKSIEIKSFMTDTAEQEKPDNGTEASWIYLEMDDETKLHDFASGKDVDAYYIDFDEPDDSPYN